VVGVVKKKKATTTIVVAFFYGGVATTKAMAFIVVAFFCVFEKKKKTTIASITFFNGFVAKKSDDKCRSPFQWFCSKEGDGNNVIAFFYDGGAVKKMIVVSYNRFLPFFIFLVLWSFWSSSLKLKINNEMVVFLNVESCC